jgi:hypothetical protein
VRRGQLWQGLANEGETAVVIIAKSISPRLVAASCEYVAFEPADRGSPSMPAATHQYTCYNIDADNAHTMADPPPPSYLSIMEIIRVPPVRVSLSLPLLRSKSTGRCVSPAEHVTQQPLCVSQPGCTCTSCATGLVLLLLLLFEKGWF